MSLTHLGLFIFAEYLQEVVEALLFYLLPEAEFDQTMFRFLVREVLVHGVIAPTIDKICDPDYMNQNIIWMVSHRYTDESLYSTIHGIEILYQTSPNHGKL